MNRYYAVRFVSVPDQIRIEKAPTPTEAFKRAFGTPPVLIKEASPRSEWKDLGSSVGVLRSDRKRIALLRDPQGWEAFR